MPGSAGQRVILVEADLRRPKVASYLGIEGAVGLTNVLVGQVALDDVLQPWGDGRLAVLPSGTIPPNPSELLGSNPMSDLVAELRRRFDLVVIDTPPLLPVTDAAVASRHADGAVVVVRYGKTSRHHLTSALRSLEAVNARLLGTVLAMTPVTSRRRLLRCTATPTISNVEKVIPRQDVPAAVIQASPEPQTQKNARHRVGLRSPVGKGALVGRPSGGPAVRSSRLAGDPSRSGWRVACLRHRRKRRLGLRQHAASARCTPASTICVIRPRPVMARRDTAGDGSSPAGSVRRWRRSSVAVAGVAGALCHPVFQLDRCCASGSTCS